jgi:hypothetical protein
MVRHRLDKMSQGGRGKAGWGDKLPKGQGRGIAIANWGSDGKPEVGTTCATVAKVEVSKSGQLYPMIRMADAPRSLRVHFGGLTNNLRFNEIGEPPVGPIGPAIGNAIFQGQTRSHDTLAQARLELDLSAGARRGLRASGRSQISQC